MAQSRFAQEGNKLSGLLKNISITHNQPDLREMAEDAQINVNAQLTLRRNFLTDLVTGFVAKTDKFAVSVDGPTLPPMGTPGDMSQAAPVAENTPTQRPDLQN